MVGFIFPFKKLAISCHQSCFFPLLTAIKDGLTVHLVVKSENRVCIANFLLRDCDLIVRALTGQTTLCRNIFQHRLLFSWRKWESSPNTALRQKYCHTAELKNKNPIFFLCRTFFRGVTYKTKVSTLANHTRCRQSNEPIRFLEMVKDLTKQL